MKLLTFLLQHGGAKPAATLAPPCENYPAIYQLDDARALSITTLLTNTPS
jgi:hypothetical protein